MRTPIPRTPRPEATAREAATDPYDATTPELPRTEAAARRADALARSLCAARERLTLPLALLAASLVLERAWCSMGFARAADFAREHLGRSARWLRDLATLHRGLSDLAGLAAALTGDDAGAPLGRRRALLVARVADASTLAAWIARARRLTVRELRDEVARALAGSTASSGSVAPCAPSDGVAPAAEVVPAAPADPSIAADLDDGEDRRPVQLSAPRAVVAAFDEAVDLYRAVEGTEATITAFIEALVAEATAGAEAEVDDSDDDAGAGPTTVPVETRSASTVGGPPAAVIESVLARSTDRWRHLPSSTDASWGLALGHATLTRLEAIVRAGATGTAAERVARMKDLLAIENEIEVHLGRLLASMGEQGAWNRLRFAGMAHYAEERLGLSRTAAQTRARAARALGRFPLVREAYEHDAIGLEAALLLGRVLSSAGGIASRAAAEAVPLAAAPRAEVEAAWVRHAAEVTVKRLRDEERALGRSIGFGLETGHGATPPTDADWHVSLRREPGTARRRVAALGLLALGVRLNGADHAGGDAGAHAAAFDPAGALIPEPDVFLRLTLPDDLACRFLAAIEAARCDLTARVESIPWDAEWPSDDGAPAATPALLAARMFSTRSRRVPAWAGLLAMIEDFVATWDPDEHDALGAADRRRAASREDAILVRDGWRCAAPACSSRRNLEVHHVRYRSRGGGDQEWNLVALCRFHHQRGEHGGLARCEGRAPLDLTWRLGTDAVRAWYLNERRIAPPEGMIIGGNGGA